MKIVIRDGLLWEGNTKTKDNIIGCMGADAIVFKAVRGEGE